MASNLINTEALEKHLMASLNQAMTEAAEPIIQQAVKDAEAAIRKRLGVMFVGMLNHSFDIQRDGQDLRILIRHDDRRQ